MDKIRFVFGYLSYWLRSKGADAIHSPFVFKLYQEVIRDSKAYYAYEEVEALRKKLVKNTNTIEVTDFGAGSNRKSNLRKICDIAKGSAKPPKYGKLLFRLVNHFKPTNILELGTSLGITTCYLAKPHSECKVTTMEGCPETSKVANKNFQSVSCNNINSVVGNFDETLDQVLQEGKTLDFVFFDGNHRKDPTLNYFKKCLPFAGENSLFIFDDIHWSKEMTEAWNQIISHKDVTISIDLYFIGLVFFKKGQAKEHFSIRF